TTVSGAAAAPIRRVAGPQVPVRVVSNGLDLSGWRLFPDGGAPEARGEVHIVAVGRLAPRKRPVGLLRILEKARARVPAAIPLPGRDGRGRMAKVRESADLFVAPAPRESFGIAALEARTAGLPVVARSQSGVADFVEHGTEGLLGRDSGALAEAVARLCEDRGLRERITRHNRANPPAAGSWPAVLAGFDRAYAEAAGRA